MEGSCEYRDHLTRGGPPACGLDTWLTIPHLKKKQFLTKCYTAPRNWLRIWTNGGALVNLVMDLWVPYKAGNFLTS
jgi:hypothetical protein